MADADAFEREVTRSRALDRRLDVLLANLSDAIVFEDENRRIQLANEAFCAMFSIPVPPSDLVGFDCAAALDQTAALFEDPEATVQDILGLLEARAPALSQVVRLRAGRVLERDYVPVFDRGVYRGHLWRYRDRTEEQRTHDALLERGNQLHAANAELARGARLKDEFLAAMSHELRTPLNSILSLSEALRVDAFGPMSDEQADAVRMIDEGGRFLLQVINDVLDVSKVEAGRMDLSIAELETELCIGSVVRLTKEAAHRKGVSVTVEIDDKARYVWGDPLRIKQVLTNLVSNAVKFTNRGGDVWIRAYRDVATQWTALEVRDTGIGIADGDRTRLFQPFVQLDASLARTHGGTGLGLALAHRLVGLHGGRIAVESEVGRGSAFTVWLPPGRSGSASMTGSYIAARDSASGSLESVPGGVMPLVLIADDNDVVVKVMERCLSMRGYRVAVARDGAAAIEQCRTLKPDLVMTDIRMPGMDGLTAIGRLRADAATAETPIIALTALAMPGDLERCLAAGADAYLSKPVPFDRLLKTVDELLRRRQERRDGDAEGGERSG